MATRPRSLDRSPSFRFWVCYTDEGEANFRGYATLERAREWAEVFRKDGRDFGRIDPESVRVREGWRRGGERDVGEEV